MSKILEKFQNYIQSKKQHEGTPFIPYEYCTRCEANLTLQKGFDPTLPYWICLGCGEMLINPASEAESNIVWICDECGTILNTQPGFDDALHASVPEWPCTNCGFVNKLSESEIYASEDEYQASQKDPYKGLSDADVLALSNYEEIDAVNDREDVFLVRHRETGQLWIKKLIAVYDKSVYLYLREHPIAFMPPIRELYESSNCLIVIEEYLEGDTVAALLGDPPHPLPLETSLHIAQSVCGVLHELHYLPTPIVHRDVKPSNILVTPKAQVYLLDMNVAKWYDPDQTDDTCYMGTRYYAAPEQAGYGFRASSARSDIYAVGVLLNVMLTGKYPKEVKADGAIWPIIETCISLNAEERYTAAELKKVLDDYLQNLHTRGAT